jgi:histidinol dehydrogenase
MVKKVVEEAMTEYTAKLDDLKETKTWITQEEREDVSSKMKDI